MNQTRNPRKERLLAHSSALAPFVGLAGTGYGIIRAFKKLDGTVPESLVAPGILEVLIFTAICFPILLFAFLVWDWLSQE